ncbi:hypothetical protein F2Q70_00002813 [Brassica cretica]|uniref:Uncharacterized protein n=1 Tax=Brassica cretica TaxID=69181 RepID=A0A8S9IWR8_BRACR|nr:hypothetical protein F2Q70_00002813 [Brassica cretica]KAF3516788.1 hypothetical protein DY000_02060330 [Brassica cretica]
MNPGTKEKQSNSSVRRTDPIRLGKWPSWIDHATSSTIRRAGLVQLDGWPRWYDRAVLIPSAKLLSQNLIKLALVSLRSEALLELYDFKTTRTRFLV